MLTPTDLPLPRVVFLLKRAQILVADIWACFGGRSYGAFNEQAIDRLTMFADYRLPQILQALGLLELSLPLQGRLQQSELLCVHAPEVVELRAGSIHAVELLKEEILRCKNAPPCHVNAVIVDFYLWDLIKEHPELASGIPIHKTRTCFY